MKVAVTLAKGHLGSSIVKRLSSQIRKNNVIGHARTLKKRKGDYPS